MKKSEATKSRILQCAYNLITKHGYEQVKITEICREACVSQSTFYLYFPTKDLLISDYYEQYMTFEQEDFARIIQSENAWEQLWCAHVLFCEKMISIGKEYCIQMHKMEKGFSQLNIINRDILQPLMFKAQVAGYIRNKSETSALYDCICYLMRGLYFTWCHADQDYDLYHEIRKMLEVVYDLPCEICNTILK